jgi:hypothetical protein
VAPRPGEGAVPDREPAGLADRVADRMLRSGAVWRAWTTERRLAAGACALLILALFLPWYQVTAVAAGRRGGLEALSQSVTGWGAFSGIEATLLLLGLGVPALLFRAAERPLRLPGGEGRAVSIAGALACALVLVRIFDKPAAGAHGRPAITTGIDWGILVALAAAALLAYAGSRMRGTDRPERLPAPAPTAPGGAPAPAGEAPTVPTTPAPPRPARARPRPTPLAPRPAPLAPRPAPLAPRPAPLAPRPAPLAPRPASVRPRPRPLPGEPSQERPVGWLSAPPQQHGQAGEQPGSAD